MAVHIPRATAREVPPDFCEFAPTHSLSEIRNRYKCGISTAQRWCEVSGVNCRRRNIAAKSKTERADSIEPHDCRAVIDTCLNCDELVCQSDCKHVKDAREAYYKATGAPRHGRPPQYDFDQKNYVAHLYRIGYTAKSIARFTGIKYQTIYSWLKGVRQYRKLPRLPPLESKRSEWEALRSKEAGDSI